MHRSQPDDQGTSVRQPLRQGFRNQRLNVRRQPPVPQQRRRRGAILHVPPQRQPAFTVTIVLGPHNPSRPRQPAPKPRRLPRPSAESTWHARPTRLRHPLAASPAAVRGPRCAARGGRRRYQRRAVLNKRRRRRGRSRMARGRPGLHRHNHGPAAQAHAQEDHRAPPAALSALGDAEWPTRRSFRKAVGRNEYGAGRVKSGG